MARQRSHSIEFKRQVFIAGESLYELSKRLDVLTAYAAQRPQRS